MAHSGGKESGLSRSITRGGEVAHISLVITEERQVERGGERYRRASSMIATSDIEDTDRYGGGGMLRGRSSQDMGV